MTQETPPDLGSTHHAGLASAITAYAEHPTESSFAGRVLAQLLHGYVLLDSTGTDRSQWRDGVIPAGYRLQFAMLTDNDTELSGLSAFTSNAMLQLRHPGVPPAEISALVLPAPDVLRLVDTLGLDFLMLDHGSPGIRMPRAMSHSALEGPMDVRVRTALALDPSQRHAGVLAALASSEPAEQLVVSVDPRSIGPGGDLSKMVLRTASNPSGARVLYAFTSFTEAALACPGDQYFPQYIENIRQVATHNGLSGVLLNPATDSDVVTSEELEAIGIRPTPAG